MTHEDEITISEKDVIDTMDIFTKVPSIILGRWVSKNKNLVKTFEGQVNGYKNQISPEDMQKLELIMQMSVSELQSILEKAYIHTGKKQLKILSTPQARPFIETNLMELKRVLD